MKPVDIPLLVELAPPSSFHYGSTIVVEHEPHSVWYEVSTTIAAEAIQRGITTDYHTFHHPPDEIDNAISRLGVDTAKAANEKKFRILDSYSLQVGEKQAAKQPFQSLAQETLQLSDWQARMQKILTASPAEIEGESKRIHIDDNTSALLSINDEKGLSDFWIKSSAMARKYDLVMFLAFSTGTASETFYGKFESLADAIVDVKAKENEDGQLRHYLRLRAVKGIGANHDSRWKEIKFKPDGRTALSHLDLEPGLAGWLKGKKK